MSLLSLDPLLPEPPPDATRYERDLHRRLRELLIGFTNAIEPLGRYKTNTQVLVADSNAEGGVAWGPALGTYAAVWKGGTTDPTCTYSSQAGTYVKMGPLVMVSGVIGTLTYAGGTGELRMTLPFTASANQQQRGGITLQFVGGFGATTAPLTCMAVVSTATAKFFRKASADARDNTNATVQVTDLTAAAQIYFSGFYFTDA